MVQKFLTIEHVPRITDFCSCIYVFGCRLGLVRLCDSDFGFTAVDDITIGITCAAFCFHIAHISFASSWYLFCLSVIVLPRLCVFGMAVSIKKVLFVFLFIKIIIIIFIVIITTTASVTVTVVIFIKFPTVKCEKCLW